MTTSLETDPRWRRLHDRSWDCPCCGLRHEGLFDLVCAEPDVWRSRDVVPARNDLGTPKNILTEDICVIEDEHYFIRCVLDLPIVGAQGQAFGFGVWSTLSFENFKTYVRSFDNGEQSGLGPWFGWLSNTVVGYPETLSLKCHVHPRNGRLRPALELEPTSHPLAIEQREGITLDRILDLYALIGHDLRPHLLD
jgi:hypothetical protein